MTARDRERWDARHGLVTGDVPQPPDALRGREGLLPAGGRALDVACGRGAVAVWLAGRGFAVDAVDVSRVGLVAAERLAAAHGVPAGCAPRWPDGAGGRVRLWAHDLDAGLPAGCAGPYRVVVCQRFRDPRCYAELGALVATGGLLVVTVLSEVGDRGGPYRAAPGELRAAFAGFEVLVDREADGEASLLARRPAG